MSDAVKALLEELNLERSVPLRDVWAAIEQHKANLSTIGSLGAHNAKLEKTRKTYIECFNALALALGVDPRELENGPGCLHDAVAKLKHCIQQTEHDYGQQCAAHSQTNEELEAALAELEKLRALLASGQCVDLAKLTDDELGEVAGARHRSSGLRARLIEKAGVKL